MTTEIEELYGISVFLRDVGDEEDDCWVPAAKGDEGAVEFVPLAELERMHDAYGIAFNQAMMNGQAASEARADIERLTSENEALREALAYYADTFCELGPFTEMCGKCSDDVCSGCKARSVLAALSKKGEGE